jgi:mRNA interferase MazF
VVIRRGEIWWVELDDPVGSSPGYRRPVLILQADWANQSRIRTVVVVTITSNLAAAEAPGNLLVQPRDSGLPKPCVVNVSQVVTLDRQLLAGRIGHLRAPLMRRVDDGVRIFLDL